MKNNQTYLRCVLGGIILLSIFLNFFALAQEGVGNMYYAAAVKSMLTSLRNFFFASFDSGGFITVDKPPLGLWIQALSAQVCGFSGLSVIIPQAIAGVLSVLVLYATVKNMFDPRAALIAGFVLAITPMFVALSRNNTMDMQLLCVQILATWAFFKSIDKKSFGYLLGSFILVGIGFNIKMGLAFIIVPAMGIVWLINGQIQLRQRILQLGIAGLVLIVVSCSWVVIVDTIPKDSRPYIGSSNNNSALELVIGHNALKRITPPQGNEPTTGTVAALTGRYSFGPASPPILLNESGTPGLLRLFNKELAGQISWFVPFILLGLFSILIQRKAKPYSPDNKALFLLYWVLWFVPYALFLSFTQGIFHRHYVLMLAPPLAALCGIVSVHAWDAFKSSKNSRFFLPVAVFFSGLFQYYLVKFHSDLPETISEYILGGSCLFFVILLLKQVSFPFVSKLPHIFFGVSILVFLSAAPLYWACTPLIYGGNIALPYASPDLQADRAKAKYVYAEPAKNAIRGTEKMYDFLASHNSGEQFLAAVPSALVYGTSLILYPSNTNHPVMTIGGFLGTDPVLTLDQLQASIREKKVRFFFVPSLYINEPTGNTRLYSWLREKGNIVDSTQWWDRDQVNLVPGSLDLYDLKGFSENQQFK